MGLRVISLLFILSQFSLPLLFAKNIDSCSFKWDKILEDGPISDDYSSLIGLCDSHFKNELQKLISKQKYLSYKTARHHMFSSIDNVDGVVCSVYSENCLETEDIPDHNIMNCEHSWPQSKGAKGIAKSDLHHLFPVMAPMNSRRGNTPFCEIKKISWEGDGSKRGYSSKGTKCFEPPRVHRGDLARAMIYFSVRYNMKIDSEQENYFRTWHKIDLVSEKEIERNELIDEIQNNRNPFIEYPQFVDLITDF